MTDLALLTAAECAGGFRAGAFSPVDVAGACLARIGRLAALNAFCIVDADGALAAARASEARWQKDAPLSPLDGVPATVKDLVSMAGFPFRRGSRTTPESADGIADAPAVARLREAGAVILGKTTTPEYGHKAVTESTLCGVTRNPWDPAKTPGGSSGGAAVAAATGMGVLHLGTDAGGSIRIPAAFTGVFGLKPTAYRVPMHPASAFGHLAVQGPLTRTVADARAMMDVIARHDPRDWAAPPLGPSDMDRRTAAKGLRVGHLRTLGDAPVSAGVEACVDAAVRALEGLGAEVTPLALDMREAADMFETIWSGTALALVQAAGPQAEAMEPSLLAIAERGRAVDAGRFAAALAGCAVLADRLQALFARFDVLTLPAMPIAAFAVGRDQPGDPDPRGWPAWTPFSYPFNLTRHPAASLPCGLTPEGLPVGLQIVAPPFRDGLALDVAEALEAVLPMPLPPCVREDA